MPFDFPDDMDAPAPKWFQESDFKCKLVKDGKDAKDGKGILQLGESPMIRRCVQTFPLLVGPDDGKLKGGLF